MTNETTDGAVIVSPYEEFDATRMAMEIAVQGEKYANAKKQVTVLQKMREPTLSRIALNLRQADPSLSISAAKMIAATSEEYADYVEQLAEAERQSNLAYARREYARARFFGKQTEEVSRRSAAYGR